MEAWNRGKMPPLFKDEQMHEALWTAYWDLPSIATRNALVEANMATVRRIARRLNRPAHVEVDDLISEGVFGLVRAIEGFDPARGWRFSSYCTKHIAGAMLDFLRSADWIGRNARRKMKKTGQDGPSMISIHARWRTDDSMHLADHKAHDGPHTFERRDHAERLIRAAGDVQRKRAMELVYLQGMSQKDAGVVMGVSESRISQLVKATLADLRAEFCPVIPESGGVGA